MSAAPGGLSCCSGTPQPSWPWPNSPPVLNSVQRRSTQRAPQFVEAPALIDEALQTMLRKIVTRLMKLPTRRGVWVEVKGSTCLADKVVDSEQARAPRLLTASACTCPIAFGPCAGQPVLTLQGLRCRETRTWSGFSAVGRAWP